MTITILPKGEERPSLRFDLRQWMFGGGRIFDHYYQEPGSRRRIAIPQGKRFQDQEDYS